MNTLIMTPDSSICLIFLSRLIDFEAVMLLQSNVITRIQIVSKVLSRDLLNTKLKFLVPLSIQECTVIFISMKLDRMQTPYKSAVLY